MRIVAGQHRGRILKTPKDSAIRPTSDKVRQAVFNALHSRGAVNDAVVLDAFCGTGALGLEALSQGAAQVVFFDRAKTSLALAEENASLLRETENCSFLLKDATHPGPRPDTIPAADLAFLDPPYRQNLVAVSLQALQMHGWLSKNCMCVAEMEKTASFNDFPGQILFDKCYGDTLILCLRLN